MDITRSCDFFASMDDDTLFSRGREEFNQGLFFDCHESLEALCRRQTDPEKSFTQALIQIAVAHHHLGRNNVKGARTLYDKALSRIDKPCPVFAFSRYNAIDFATLVACAKANLALLTRIQQMQDNDMIDQIIVPSI